MKMLLKKLNIVADTAENGRIAVDMIMGATEPYHLVLMDNLMPEMVMIVGENKDMIVITFDICVAIRMEWRLLLLLLLLLPLLLLLLLPPPLQLLPLLPLLLLPLPPTTTTTTITTSTTTTTTTISYVDY